jgi:hypothetical protein
MGGLIVGCFGGIILLSRPGLGYAAGGDFFYNLFLNFLNQP